jgi:hypothetical protein
MPPINFNPNLPPNDAPSLELIAEKLGGLMLGTPEAFEEEPELPTGGWDSKTFNSMFDDDDEIEEEEA